MVTSLFQEACHSFLTAAFFLLPPLFVSLVSLTPEDAGKVISVAQDTIIGDLSQTKATAFTFSSHDGNDKCGRMVVMW